MSGRWDKKESVALITMTKSRFQQMIFMSALIGLGLGFIITWNLLT